MSPDEILKRAAESPYDAPDDLEPDEGRLLKAADWAHAAARGVIRDLSGRRAIKNGFEQVDEETRLEIVRTLADIIRQAAAWFNEEPSTKN